MRNQILFCLIALSFISTTPAKSNAESDPRALNQIVGMWVSDELKESEGIKIKSILRFYPNKIIYLNDGMLSSNTEYKCESNCEDGNIIIHLDNRDPNKTFSIKVNIDPKSQKLTLLEEREGNKIEQFDQSNKNYFWSGLFFKAPMEDFEKYAKMVEMTPDFIEEELRKKLIKERE